MQCYLGFILLSFTAFGAWVASDILNNELTLEWLSESERSGLQILLGADASLTAGCLLLATSCLLQAWRSRGKGASLVGLAGRLVRSQRTWAGVALSLVLWHAHWGAQKALWLCNLGDSWEVNSELTHFVGELTNWFFLQGCLAGGLAYHALAGPRGARSEVRAGPLAVKVKAEPAAASASVPRRNF